MRIQRTILRRLDSAALEAVDMFLNQAAQVVLERGLQEGEELGPCRALCKLPIVYQLGELGLALGYQFIEVERRIGRIDVRDHNTADQPFDFVVNILWQFQKVFDLGGGFGSCRCGVRCGLEFGLCFFSYHKAVSGN